MMSSTDPSIILGVTLLILNIGVCPFVDDGNGGGGGGPPAVTVRSCDLEVLLVSCTLDADTRSTLRVGGGVLFERFGGS